MNLVHPIPGRMSEAEYQGIRVDSKPAQNGRTRARYQLRTRDLSPHVALYTGIAREIRHSRKDLTQ